MYHRPAFSEAILFIRVEYVIFLYSCEFFFRFEGWLLDFAFSFWAFREITSMRRRGNLIGQRKDIGQWKERKTSFYKLFQLPGSLDDERALSLTHETYTGSQRKKNYIWAQRKIKTEWNSKKEMMMKWREWRQWREWWWEERLSPWSQWLSLSIFHCESTFPFLPR